MKIIHREYEKVDSTKPISGRYLRPGRIYKFVGRNLSEFRVKVFSNGECRELNTLYPRRGWYYADRDWIITKEFKECDHNENHT